MHSRRLAVVGIHHHCFQPPCFFCVGSELHTADRCNIRVYRDGGHEQLISNGGRFKPAFAERDRKQTMKNLRGISTNWFKNRLSL
jgi:hypothetical protein